MNQPNEATPQEINERLRQQYADLAELAGGLAHEIKNPLSTIRLNVELLGEDLAEDPSPNGRRALRKIETVQRECQRLQDLLDDFLKFARVRQLAAEPSDLNRAVERVFQFIEPEAQEAGVELVRFLDADLPSVLLDEESFHAALLNLVINALHAMPEGGQLVAQTQSAPSGAVLSLIDTGAGMEPAVAARIFEPFFSTKSGGSGLGLPTVRKIIEAHQGTISVESELGRGTQFTIRLPSLPRLAHVEQLDSPAGDDT